MTIDLTPFKALIKERCGLLFEGGSEDKLATALHARIAAADLADAAAYHARLGANHGEFQNLINMLTINETYFFREPEQIRLLAERLVPRLLARSAGGAPLRILSAGCSSGEEPYSIAMALTEKYGASVSRLFAFCGGDIDSAVLAKAREGRYTEFSFRGVPGAIRGRYFDRSGGSYVLKDSVRRCVEFREFNLLAPQFPPEGHGFDVIFCRNVSIYFDAPTRKLIQQNLAALLNADGILMTGAAETLANDLGVLPLVEEDGLFYFVKGEPPPAAAAVFRQAARREPLPPAVAAAAATWPLIDAPMPAPPTAATASWEPPAPAAATSFSLEDARRLTREKRYDEAMPMLEQRLAAAGGDAGALLLKAHIQLNRMDFAAAEAAAAAVLATDPWSVDALLLLGLVAKWRNQTDAAIRSFKQVVYTRHECWPAHYYLADLYRHTDAAELARREYRIVLQLLAGVAPDAGARVVPLDLPAGEIRFLCEHQLARLAGHAGAATAR